MAHEIKIIAKNLDQFAKLHNIADKLSHAFMEQFESIEDVFSVTLKTSYMSAKKLVMIGQIDPISESESLVDWYGSKYRKITICTTIDLENETKEYLRCEFHIPEKSQLNVLVYAKGYLTL